MQDFVWGDMFSLSLAHEMLFTNMRTTALGPPFNSDDSDSPYAVRGYGNTWPLYSGLIVRRATRDPVSLFTLMRQ
jgi:hypothetical protein